MDVRRLLLLQSGEDTRLSAKLMRPALSLAGGAYSAVVRGRNRLFDARIRKARPLGKPTISIGNITAGGTGKTPMVIHIAGRLEHMGLRPAVLLRGYKSEKGKSDEALLIAQSLGAQVPVCCHGDRAKAAAQALEQNPAVDCFVLDDGFQHRQTFRDLDVVLIDATAPFGFDHVLPRGMLREPATGLKRADAVIVTRADQVSRAAGAEIDQKIISLTGASPLAHVAFGWDVLWDEKDNEYPVDQLSSMKVAGMCGIGNPQAFLTSLRAVAREVVDSQIFGDHQAPGRQALFNLLECAKARGADGVVTTEKDWVKWKLLFTDSALAALPVSILRPRVSPVFLDGEPALGELLKQCVKPV